MGEHEPELKWWQRGRLMSNHVRSGGLVFSFWVDRAAWPENMHLCDLGIIPALWRHWNGDTRWVAMVKIADGRRMFGRKRVVYRQYFSERAEAERRVADLQAEAEACDPTQGWEPPA